MKIIHQAIKLSDKDPQSINDGIRDAVHGHIPKIERLMPVLSRIITVAPILGLTGTVLGLMDIFNVILWEVESVILLHYCHQNC